MVFRFGCESTQGSDCMYRLALVPEFGMRAGHKREKYSCNYRDLEKIPGLKVIGSSE